MQLWYKEVPTEYYANLMYRECLLRRAHRDRGFQHAVLQACREDVLFFFSAMCWLFEPRDRLDDVTGSQKSAIVPFIPWKHQYQLISDIRENLGKKDVIVVKSRGEGLSWIGVLLALHDWLFKQMATIGMISKDEAAADKSDNLGSLLPKIDWELEMLPEWMSGVKSAVGRRNGDYTRSGTDHMLINHRTKSTIISFAAGADVASGERFAWVLFDEAAKFPRGKDQAAMDSLQHTTESRLIISTPKGANGIFYDAVHAPSNAKKIEVDWKDNPEKSKGLYKMVDGRPSAIDPENNPLPKSYVRMDREVADMFERLRQKGYTLAGVVRSPWYDSECDRPNANPISIAQELDRDFGGSSYRIFGDAFLEVVDRTVRKNQLEGYVSVTPEGHCDFEHHANGPVRLWCSLDMDGNPAKHEYVVGCDIAAGQGGEHTSNSVLTVIDLTTREQVLEYATKTVEPTTFAMHAIAICRWFHGAYLAWEHMGPGTAFTQKVIDERYEPVYRRTLLYKGGHRKKNRKEIGWISRRDTKETLCGDLKDDVLNGALIVRSKELVHEFGHFIRKGGEIVHAIQYNSKDDASAGLSHGDRVIAIGIAVQAARDKPSLPPMERNTFAPQANEDVGYGSLAWRMQQWEEEDQFDSTWDRRTLADYAGVA